MLSQKPKIISQMKKINFVFMGFIFLILFGCANKINKPDIYCNVERIEVSMYPKLKTYNIYITLVVKNNSKKMVHLPLTGNSLNPQNITNKSPFYANIDLKKINLIRIDSNSSIPPNDSVHVFLLCKFYKPDYNYYINDSLYSEQIKKIQIIYEYNLNNSIPDDTIRSLNIIRSKYSKFSELKNNISSEDVFDLK